MPSEPTVAGVPAVDPLRLMAGGFAELGDRIGHENATEDLTVVAETLLAQVPASLWATVTVRARDGWTTVAGTDDRARAADRVQYDLGVGPSLQAFVDGVVRVDDLAADPRWPELRGPADGPGFPRSVLAVRLQADDEDTIGTLTAYAPEPAAFSPAAADAALLLAGFAAAVISAGRAQRSIGHLRVALETNREIGVAIGVLMAVRLIDRDAAFVLLQQASQNSNRKLRDVATEVADTGRLPDAPTTPVRVHRAP